MAKMIKFDLPIDGVKVATLDDLRDHFTTEVVGHFRSGTLARWLQSRGMARELAGVEGLTAGNDTTTLKELCRIFEIEADDTAIAAALIEATGVPGIRPDQMSRKQHAWSPGDTFQDCPECPKMVVIPPGSFMMGSPEEEEGRYGDEGPMHEVRIDYQLAVGVYPVTFDEWDMCVSGGGCSGYQPPGRGRVDDPGRRPVVNVNWEDAQGYVRWLSWKTEEEYRLLSEAEWEYVARAGAKTRYSWGDEIGWDRANCRGCGDRQQRRTSPVGSFSANGFGLYDVHGNVWEWVEDCWNSGYAGAPSDGSAWESGNYGNRVARGGSWDNSPGLLRSAIRIGLDSGIRNDLIGLRVARTLD